MIESEKIVGVIGASGVVGRYVCEYVARDYRVLHGRHSNSQLKQSQYIDVYNPQSIQLFVKACDVVVNCAGPTYLIGSNVSRVCNEYKKPYVDVFGGDFLEHAIKSYVPEIPQIINAGSQPGLSGILLTWMLTQYSLEIKHLDIYYGGNEDGGISALLDIILSTIDGYGKANTIWKDNREHRTPYSIDDKKIIDDEVPPVFIQPYFTKELLKICQRFDVQNLAVYNIYESLDRRDEILKGCQMFIQRQQSMEQQVYQFKSSIQHSKQDENMWFVMKVIARCKDKTATVRITEKDSSKLTAIITYLSVKQILESQLPNQCMWAFEALNPETVIDTLIEEGIHVDMNERPEVSAMEEGQI